MPFLSCEIWVTDLIIISDMEMTDYKILTKSYNKILEVLDGINSDPSTEGIHNQTIIVLS